MAAPKGNQNAKRGAEWKSALKRAMARYSQTNWREGLDRVADQVVQQAVMGEDKAWKEIADRLDGRPTQAVDLDVDADVSQSITVTVPGLDDGSRGE